VNLPHKGCTGDEASIAAAVAAAAAAAADDDDDNDNDNAPNVHDPGDGVDGDGVRVENPGDGIGTPGSVGPQVLGQVPQKPMLLTWFPFTSVCVEHHGLPFVELSMVHVR